MDVAAWLKGLDLERYVPAFRDNDIDAEILIRLTADDLIGLGVTSIGHRRKLLSAIAAIGAEAPAPAGIRISAAAAIAGRTRRSGPSGVNDGAPNKVSSDAASTVTKPSP